MKFTTFISGQTDSGEYRSRRVAGLAKSATIERVVALLGITRSARAEAVSFDTSGKGRHVRRVLL